MLSGPLRSAIALPATAKQDGKHLKENENIACETYKAVGEIKTLGRYVVMRRCDDFQEDPGVKCIVCFASGEQIRDLCALAHFGSHNVFNLISVPWGPACATLVTYPAGMAENASLSQISIGPTILPPGVGCPKTAWPWESRQRSPGRWPMM